MPVATDLPFHVLISSSSEVCEPDSEPVHRILESYAGSGWVVAINGLDCYIMKVKRADRSQGIGETEIIVETFHEEDLLSERKTILLEDVRTFHVY